MFCLEGRTIPALRAAFFPCLFKALNLPPPILRGIQGAGYTDPTPIQLRAISRCRVRSRSHWFRRRPDRQIRAAFALPILRKLGAHGRGAECSCSEPTRETCGAGGDRFSAILPGYRASCSGGVCWVGYGHQRTELKTRSDVVVATPGRLNWII